MKKFLGRMFTSPKAHLLQVARVLALPGDALKRMQDADADTCEAVFLSYIEGRSGGPVDWRGDASEIYDILTPCLKSEELGYLPPLGTVQVTGPARIVKFLDSRMEGAPRALRALESFGDFLIVLLVPREKLAEFDQAAGSWAA